MKKYILLLALVSAVTQADVYKSVNDQGEVVYSDRPSQGSERVKLPGLPTYTAPPVKASPKAAREPAQKAIYESFAFSKPQNDETVRNNLGIVMIETRLTPSLQARTGHRIQFYLDGEPNGPLIDRTALTMSNIERGAHSLSASVLDRDGKVLISTGDITVHVKRKSQLDVDDDYPKLGDQPRVDHIPEGDRKYLEPADIKDPNPNILDRTPNVRDSENTPNIRTNNPNIRTTTPNIINPPPPKPTPLPSTGGK